MIETQVNARTYHAIRNAHAARGAVLRGFFQRLRGK